MGSLFDKEELENLESLKQDLVGPVKAFLKEVHRDTVGDAKKYYSAKAQKVKKEAQCAQDKAKAQMAELRREQEQMRKRRKLMQKRAAIVLALLSVFSLVIISFALSSHADGQDLNSGNPRTDDLTAPGVQEVLPYHTPAVAGCSDVSEYGGIPDRAREIAAAEN